MQNAQRQLLHRLLVTLEGLARGAVALDDGGAASTLVEEDPAARAYRPPQTVLSPQKLQALYDQLLEELRTTRERLNAHMSEREAYLILFPLVVTFDELVQLRYVQPHVGGWPQLQRELFQVDQGGELFYTLLDEALDVSHYPPLCYEVFFFCLRVGFRGRHSGNEDRIAGYLQRIGQRLQIPELGDSAASQLDRAPARIRPAHSPLWYYAAAFVALLGIYLLLGTLGAEEDITGDSAAADGSAFVAPLNPAPKKSAMTPLRGQKRAAANAKESKATLTKTVAATPTTPLPAVVAPTSPSPVDIAPTALSAPIVPDLPVLPPRALPADHDEAEGSPDDKKVSPRFAIPEVPAPPVTAAAHEAPAARPTARPTAALSSASNNDNSGA